jgi:uncharacterized protein (TIGR02145 family)/uncharacterized repeat protein (TIGR02543 family)
MKRSILYAIATAAIAAIAIIGCDGDFGERSEKMDAFLDKFSGKSNRYTITFNANGASKGSPPQPIDVIRDSTTRLPSNSGGLSKTGFDFEGWSEDSSGNYGNHETGEQYTPKSNITLYARWIPKDVITSKVTVISDGIGFSGSGEYVDGETVTIKAGDAPEGKQFQNWTATPSVTFANSSSSTTTFTMPTQAVTVTAYFGAVTEGKYAVTVASIGVDGSGSDSYEAGTTVSINAGDDPFGHRFQNWTTESAGVIFGNANNRETTFVMPGSAVTVTANFYEVPTYKVTVTSVGNGASTDSSYKEGDIVTIKAGEAPDKKRFEDWTVTNGDVTLAKAENATTTFIMPARDVAVTANFRDNTYAVTVFAGTGATGDGEYYPGDMVSVKAGTPPTGFTFNGWTCSNSNVAFTDANSAATTFIMPSAAVTIMAKLSGSAFTDGRNSKTYKTVAIGAGIWMAENLNYDTADGTGSWCYDESNCTQYGRLYNWNTAMGGATSSSANPSGVRGVCPAGWHLPSRGEWDDLMTAVGGSSMAGAMLKSTSGWYDDGNGTDGSGFTALPGGYRYSVGSCTAGGGGGHWWSTTEYGSGNAYDRRMYYNYDGVYEDYNGKGFGYSVRCVRD